MLGKVKYKMLKKYSSKKLPTGYALKKRLLNLEYKTKLVGEDLKGDYRIIVLRTSKLPDIISTSESHSKIQFKPRTALPTTFVGSESTEGTVNSTSFANQRQEIPKVIRKGIKKTLFNTVEGIKRVNSLKALGYGAGLSSNPLKGISKESSAEQIALGIKGNKLPVTYIYSVSPPAKNLKEQFEDLALLAPYIPFAQLGKLQPSPKGGSDQSSTKDISASLESGFLGCLVASPPSSNLPSYHSNSERELLSNSKAQPNHKRGDGESSIIGDNSSRLVFYYPNQLKKWLGPLIESGNLANLNSTGFTEVLQTLDFAVFNLLIHVNSSLDTLSIFSHLATQSSPRLWQEGVRGAESKGTKVLANKPEGEIEKSPSEKKASTPIS
jgi:hypothetical protein